MDNLSPMITGTVGGLIALGGLYFWSKSGINTHLIKSKSVLKKENRWRVLCANIAGFMGLLSGILAYKYCGIPDNDWRGVGIGFGLMGALPMLIIILSSMPRGIIGIKECFFWLFAQKCA